MLGNRDLSGETGIEVRVVRDLRLTAEELWKIAYMHQFLCDSDYAEHNKRKDGLPSGLFRDALRKHSSEEIKEGVSCVGAVWAAKKKELAREDVMAVCRILFTRSDLYTIVNVDSLLADRELVLAIRLEKIRKCWLSVEHKLSILMTHAEEELVQLLEKETQEELARCLGVVDSTTFLKYSDSLPGADAATSSEVSPVK